jgi:hypothetical protein
MWIIKTILLMCAHAERKVFCEKHDCLVLDLVCKDNLAWTMHQDDPLDLMLWLLAVTFVAGNCPSWMGFCVKAAFPMIVHVLHISPALMRMDPVALLVQFFLYNTVFDALMTVLYHLASGMLYTVRASWNFSTMQANLRDANAEVAILKLSLAQAKLAQAEADVTAAEINLAQAHAKLAAATIAAM